MEKSFQIKAMGLGELASYYFPGEEKSKCYRKLWSWIKQSETLQSNLNEAGYKPFQKILTPKQVRVIVEHLGEP